MYKILIAIATLSILASCTLMSEKPVAPVVPAPETKIDSTTMAEDNKTMDDATVPQDTMTPDGMEKPMVDDVVDTKKDDMIKPEAMMDDDKMKKDDAMMKPSGYMNYDEEKVSEALASGQKVALFFHATWCPSCRSLDKAISSETSSISADTLIMKVDFDSSTELKKKYRVVGQHTTVVLNADGTEKSKKLGARGVADIFE